MWLYLSDQPAPQAGALCFICIRDIFLLCPSSFVCVSSGIFRRTSHPFGDNGRQFLEAPSVRNGDECLPKGRFLGTGEHQAGPNESPGEEEEHARRGMSEATKK